MERIRKKDSKNNNNNNKIRFIIPVLLLSLTIILFTGAASAADIYISPTNNTISNATAAASAGDTLHLADGNYTGSNNRNITINKNMTIIGQSQTGTIIDAKGQDRIFFITSGVTVTIRNLTLTNGNITGGDRVTSSGGAIYNNGTLTVTDSTFTDNTASYFGGAIHNNAVLTVTGSTFTGNIGRHGGAIHNYVDSTLTVRNSVFTGNNAAYGTSSSNGGAIYNYGTATVTGSTFTGNTATSQGGAINSYGVLLIVRDSIFTGNTAKDGGALHTHLMLSDEGNTLAVQNSTFTDNTATLYGGAISNLEGVLNVTSSTFTNNTVNNDTYGGGAICNSGGFTTISNSTFTENNAANYGGAIYNEDTYYEEGILTVTGSTFTGNNARVGGAIYEEATSTVTNSTFTGNTAKYGGAIYSRGTLDVTSSNFNGNSAPNGRGGAIYNISGTLNVINSTFTNNAATVIGGAIINNANLTVSGSTFTGNTATQFGGAISNDGGNLSVTGSKFIDNTSYDDEFGGGAIYSRSGALDVTGSSFIGNSAPNGSGGAIYSRRENSTINFNRIVGNTAPTGSAIFSDGGSADARYNWWGENSDPRSKVSGNVTVGPWIVLTVKADPDNLYGGVKSNITSDLLHDSNGVYHDPKYGHVPDGIPVTFTATKGTINPSSGTLINGSKKSTFTANSLGTATIKAKVDNQTVSKNIYLYPNLSFELSTSKGTHYYGDTIHYYITIKNYGKLSANVSVYDKLPYGLKYLSSKATKGSYKLNTSTWTIGTLKPGQTAKLDIKVLVNKVGDITNKATLKDSIWKTYGIITVGFEVPKAVPLSELIKASSQIKKYYETHRNRLPSRLKVAGQTLTMAQLLKLFTTATINFSKKNTKPISVSTVGKAPYPGGIYASGKLYNYLTVAGNIKTFIDKKGRAPNYAQTTLGKIPFSKLVYMYAKVINFYGQNKRLPNYVATYKI